MIERLRKVINVESPKGLRKLLSEYIRLCGQIQNQKSRLLDLKLEINRILGHNYALIMHRQVQNRSNTRSRSSSVTKIGMQNALNPLESQDLKKLSMRRTRSHSAKAANF
jgi:hypothetical protein